MRAASIVPSVNGINVCSITRTVFGKFVTITATLQSGTITELSGVVNWNAECNAVQHRRRNRTFLLFARGISARNSVAPRRDNGVSPDLQQPPSVTLIPDSSHLLPPSLPNQPIPSLTS